MNKNLSLPILVGLGANLPSKFGAPEETLNLAKEKLEVGGIKILKTSKTYLTAPVPVSDDPYYHNEVISIETTLGPHALLKKLLDVENEFGRERSVKNAPRVLDLDLIVYKDEILGEELLEVPHPRMHERAFVLFPLKDVASEWIHPKLKLSVEELIENLPTTQEIKVMS